jgi:glycine/D-amino acid oxidase-like deaminating enzyme
VTAPVTHRWAAHAAWTTDLLPIDERVDEGVHVVGGYSGHGNVLGGLLARAAALRLLENR